jgi:hypothetical protein
VRGWVRTDDGFCERVSDVRTFRIEADRDSFKLRLTLRYGAGDGPYHATVSGLPALEFVMAEAPHLLEGVPGARRGKWAWAAHNLIGHPLMQLLAFAGLRDLAFRVHDATVPWPKPKARAASGGRSAP